MLIVVLAGRPPGKNEEAQSGVELSWVEGRVHVVAVKVYWSYSISQRLAP